MLTVAPCRSLCDWAPTRGRSETSRVFACRGCGSQWARGQAWSPRQADGSWPPGVREELARPTDTRPGDDVATADSRADTARP